MSWPAMLLLLLMAANRLNPVLAGVTVDFDFITFTNNEGKRNDGFHCDPLLIGHPCETYFKFCIKESSTTPNDLTNCWYNKTTTVDHRITDSNIDFKTANIGLPRNILIHRDQWHGNVGFYVEVWDEDYGTSNDLIDIHAYRKVLAIPVNGTYQKTTTGKRNLHKTTLKFSLRVYCDKFYYGSSCKTFCKAQDDNVQGHYTCTSTGGHVCRQNWHNLPVCKTFCKAQDDNVQGHYTCNSTGGHVCRSGWYREPKCLNFCVPSNDDYNGHYTCTIKGSRMCTNNWYSPSSCSSSLSLEDNAINGPHNCSHINRNCTVYCLPEDSDSRGHFRCSTTGMKICHDNWYGSNCTKYCKAASDNTLGHYNCSEEGEKKCTDNYFGDDCVRFCLDTAGHYSCEPSTGAKICLEPWVGQFCNISKSTIAYSKNTASYTSNGDVQYSSFDESSTSIRSITSYLASSVLEIQQSLSSSFRVVGSSLTIVDTISSASTKQHETTTTDATASRVLKTMTAETKTVKTIETLSKGKQSSISSQLSLFQTKPSFVAPTVQRSISTKSLNVLESESQLTNTPLLSTAIQQPVSSTPRSDIMETAILPSEPTNSKRSGKRSVWTWLLRTQTGNIVMAAFFLAVLFLVVLVLVIRRLKRARVRQSQEEMLEGIKERKAVSINEDKTSFLEDTDRNHGEKARVVGYNNKFYQETETGL